MNRVYLAKGRDISLQRNHPWIFSRAISRLDNIEEGDRVIVSDHRGMDRCIAHYHDASIALRVLTQQLDWDIAEYWHHTLTAAIALRQQINLPNTASNSYRLINGEGDHAPGLIVDIYNDTAVIQPHTLGMYREVMDIYTALMASSLDLKYAYCKPVKSLTNTYPNISEGYIEDEGPELLRFAEHNIQYQSHIDTAQKTGFFLDQRVNRKLIGDLAHGKTVLNNYCYTGGFSLCALAGGAAHVTSVDISDKAIAQLDALIELNPFDSSRHTSVVADVKKYLAGEVTQQYDIVITDPPAFAKSQKKRHAAVQAYKRMNAIAMQHVVPGGMLFAFSCSQVVGRQLFYDTLVAAAIETDRKVQLVYQLNQGPDHTIDLFHSEGHYLKGFGLIVQ